MRDKISRVFAASEKFRIVFLHAGVGGRKHYSYAVRAEFLHGLLDLPLHAEASVKRQGVRARGVSAIFDLRQRRIHAPKDEIFTADAKLLQRGSFFAQRAKKLCGAVCARTDEPRVT